MEPFVMNGTRAALQRRFAVTQQMHALRRVGVDCIVESMRDGFIRAEGRFGSLAEAEELCSRLEARGFRTRIVFERKAGA